MKFYDDSIVKDIKKVQHNIGYCPQFDCLYDELTAREHLQLYCRLRGVPPKDEKQVRRSWMAHMCVSVCACVGRCVFMVAVADQIHRVHPILFIWQEYSYHDSVTGYVWFVYLALEHMFFLHFKMLLVTESKWKSTVWKKLRYI